MRNTKLLEFKLSAAKCIYISHQDALLYAYFDNLNTIETVIFKGMGVILVSAAVPLFSFRPECETLFIRGSSLGYSNRTLIGASNRYRPTNFVDIKTSFNHLLEISVLSISINLDRPVFSYQSETTNKIWSKK